MGSRKERKRVYHVETLDIRWDSPVWKWDSEHNSLESAVRESQELQNCGIVNRIVDC